MASDQVVIAVSRDGALRARAARTTSLCAEITRRHKCEALAAHALSRALTCAALFPVSLKDCDRLSVQFSGGGSLRGLFVELRAPGHLRGYPRAPDAAIWAGDPRGRRIGRALLPGIVHVLRQVPDGNYAQGQTELVSGEIDEDLEAYFHRSEQVATRLRTAIALDSDSADVEACAGVLVQALPGGDDERLSAVDLDDVAPDTAPEQLLSKVLGAGFNVLEIVPLRFACPCTRERALSGVGLLEDDQIIDMIHKDKGAEVRCDFCGEVYNFDRDELTRLLDR